MLITLFGLEQANCKFLTEPRTDEQIFCLFERYGMKVDKRIFKYPNKPEALSWVYFSDTILAGYLYYRTYPGFGDSICYYPEQFHYHESIVDQKSIDEKMSELTVIDFSTYIKKIQKNHELITKRDRIEEIKHVDIE